MLDNESLSLSFSLFLLLPRFRLIAISLSFTNSNTILQKFFIKCQAIRHLVDNRFPVMMIGRHRSSSSIPIKEIPISVDLFGASGSSAQKLLSLPLFEALLPTWNSLMIRHYRWYGYWNGCLTTVSAYVPFLSRFRFFQSFSFPFSIYTWLLSFKKEYFKGKRFASNKKLRGIRERT